MAIGDIQEGLGGAEEAAAAEPAGAAGVDPFAVAIAAREMDGDPALRQAAADYLRKQGRLVELQIDDLRKLGEVQLSHLKLRRFIDAMKAGVQVVVIVLAAVIGLGVLVMLYDAFASRSVVVDAFRTPSALAGRGLTGDVVAEDLLDALKRLQAATRTTGKGLDAKSAWASDIRVQIPATGVSIGEVDRLLRQRFGHDTHIGGTLIQTETGGLSLTVRGDGVPAASFAGGTGDLEKLTAAAAEYVYGRSQPFRYAVYLLDVKRVGDALAFIPGAFARAGGDGERAALAGAWGTALGSLGRPAEAIAKYRLAIALDPHDWAARDNLIFASANSAGEEAAWREGRAFLLAVQAAAKKDRPPLRLLNNPAWITWDLPLTLASSLDDASHNAGAGASITIVDPSIAEDYARLHDPDRAARHLANSDPDDAGARAEAKLLAAYVALDRGDGAAAIAPLEAVWKASQTDPGLRARRPYTPCFLGLAYALAGRPADAEAAFARADRWSWCDAMHGAALEHAGDLAGAERIWADGLRVAPDLPMIRLQRGLSELNRGDLAAAGADFSAANATAPHFADPLKAWGDLLARQGRWAAALAKYDQALQYAPAWAALRQAREAAAKRS